ncbi:hypothetical protein FOZ63_006464, partial [Perkinsus olseni]
MTALTNGTLPKVEGKEMNLSLTAATTTPTPNGSLSSSEREEDDDNMASDSASVQNQVTFVVSNRSPVETVPVSPVEAAPPKKVLPVAPIFNDCGSFTLEEMVEPMSGSRKR